jgi:hypothetical protein
MMAAINDVKMCPFETPDRLSALRAAKTATVRATGHEAVVPRAAAKELAADYRRKR